MSLYTTKMLAALKASMKVVRSAQLTAAKDVEVKVDGSLVTLTDQKSEEVARRLLRQTGIEIWAEEHGLSNPASSPCGLLVDPLDGTRPFTSGLQTSTVIVALYDKKMKQIIECHVGLPVTGQIWSAEYDLELGVFSTDLKVWRGPKKSKEVVFLDISPKPTREGSQTLTNDEQAALFTCVFKTGTAVMMAGSNGLHHALVAQGHQDVVGAITTSVGGPWDVAPALLVVAAGGAAKAFTRQNGKWKERDPLDPMSFRFLVTGNNVETVERLSKILTSF
jgi:fructose-1,6-bisphosphatase/inositol monophosphatase family enzyme